MNLRGFLLLYVVSVFSPVWATDYCKPELCKGLGRHIACEADYKFKDLCPDDAKMVNITVELQDMIVEWINEKRNLVAGGGAKKHPRACRMATMQWDNELAKLAELNVKYCVLTHDKCRNTDAFRYVGQNLAWLGYAGPLDCHKKFKHILKTWYDEVENSTIVNIYKYPKENFGPIFGHFTILVADRNIRIGCAASTYSYERKGYKAFLATCNFATTNVINHPIYKSCGKAAEECKSGKNSKYPNLCSTSEQYKVNEWS